MKILIGSFSMRCFSPIALGIFLGGGMMLTPLSSQSGAISLAVMFVAFCVLCTYVRKQYGKSAFIGVIAVALLGVCIEFVGITTCLPYGCFQYSAFVGPRFLGTFPRSLLFIWPLIVVAMVQWINTSQPVRRQAIIGGVTLMLFDVLLDPVAVALGLWSYADGGVWFGVPLSNYFGWLITGTISSYLIVRRSRELVGDAWLKFIGILLWSMYGTAFLRVALPVVV